MRNQWFLTWAFIAAVSGCTSSGFPGVPWMAQQPEPTRMASKSGSAASQPKPGFTQRVVDAITPGPPQNATPPNSSAASPAQQKLDPISLGFASGPPNPELYLSMAQLSDRGGNPAHARSMYQRALSMESDNLDALLGLARLEDREGRMTEALRIYQQAAAAHPQNAKALNDLALCQARNGQLPMSLNLLGQAIQLQPQKQLYRNNIAKVLIELNRLDEAVLHQAAVHPPAVAQYNVGVLLHQRGRSDEAIRFLTAATHIDPQLREAHALLARITNNSTRLAGSDKPAANDGVLPTPMAQPGQTPATGFVGQPYPTTGAVSAAPPVAQTIPAETARVPVGNAPSMLPPVR